MKIHKDFPGLCKEKTPAGTPRWRVRTEGDKFKRITLPVGPDHPDFEAHYEAGRSGKKLKISKQKRPVGGTLDELSRRYLEWLEQQVTVGKFSPYTLGSRRTGLKNACECRSRDGKGPRMGAMKSTMPKAAFEHIRDSFGARTGAADTCMKALRAAYHWGESHGFAKDSDVFDVTSGHVSKGGATPWSEEDERAFLAFHGPGTMARRWYLLARNSRGRVGDTHKFGPKHTKVVGDMQFLDWQPSKKGSRHVTIPMDEELMIELAGLPDDIPAFLLTEQGTPFASAAALGNKIRDWVRQAGLVDAEGKAARSQHGIRKRGAEEIAEATGSVFAVMAILSHSDIKTAQIYVDKIQTERLAEKAAREVEALRKQVSVPRGLVHGTQGVKTPEKTMISKGEWQPVGESNPSFQVENLAS